MAAAALEQSILESKDKDTLLEMAKALGVKVNARLKKGEIIDKILDTTGSSTSAPSAPAAPRDEASGNVEQHHRSNGSASNGDDTRSTPRVDLTRTVNDVSGVVTAPRSALVPSRNNSR